MSTLIKKIIKQSFLVYGILAMSTKTVYPTRTTTIDHSITIFVHGTFPARKLLQNYIARPLLYCPQGLSLAKDLPDSYHFHKLAQGCVDCNNQLYSLDQFYVFGWQSEHVYNSVRKQAAQELVQQMQMLVDDYYERYNVIPNIRLLGFSHGGNVVLHTANFLPLKVDETVVDVEAWLFGTPVQRVNKDLVNSPCFKKIYSFYSKKDWLQRMDPQGLRDSPIDIKHVWSNRMFEPTDRCVQIELTVNGKSISHSYYRYIFKYFPILAQMAREQSDYIDSGFIKVDLKK